MNRRDAKNAKKLNFNRRSCGLLMHPTSLPGPHGCGDLGQEAHRFVDFLARAGQRWWQMLPLSPPGPGNSPYSALSAFAGSPILVSLDGLTKEGPRRRGDIQSATGLDSKRVRYPAVTRYRLPRLRTYFAAFRQQRDEDDFQRFKSEQSGWLDDYALFMALRKTQGGKAWTSWPSELRDRRASALRDARRNLREEIEFERFVQYLFHRQWSALKNYSAQRGVGLIGDIPIFVAHDSADVWSNPKLFLLDATGRPKLQSGCPPDSFSRDGQLWGHPLYDWKAHESTGFAWWIERFRYTLAMFDAVRIDHFLGFHRCWAVPGRAKTARRGRWMPTPGNALFSRLRKSLGPANIIAEDLGLVTTEAEALRARFGFPGMRILQCAFGEGDGARYHQPHNYPRDCVVYTGTHDNDTTAGWFESLPPRVRAPHPMRSSGWGRSDTIERDRFLRYAHGDGREIHWDMIRLANQSPANTVIIPVQDVLGLDSTARMNVPAKAKGNWEWRMTRGSLTASTAKRLRQMAETYQRDK